MIIRYNIAHASRVRKVLVVVITHIIHYIHTLDFCTHEIENYTTFAKSKNSNPIVYATMQNILLKWKLTGTKSETKQMKQLWNGFRLLYNGRYTSCNTSLTLSITEKAYCISTLKKCSSCIQVLKKHIAFKPL